MGLGLRRRLTLEEGVGQVVERDRLGQAEQVRHLFEQVALDRRALRQQGIGGPVEAHHAHPLEVHAQQLAEGRTLAQPAPAGALRARCRHARDDGGQGQRALRAVEAQPFQQSLQAELLHGPQPGILDADRARADQLQGTHIHRLQVGALDCGGRCAIEELRGDALRMPFDLFRTGQRYQLSVLPVSDGAMIGLFDGFSVPIGASLGRVSRGRRRVKPLRGSFASLRPFG